MSTLFQCWPWSPDVWSALFSGLTVVVLAATGYFAIKQYRLINHKERLEKAFSIRTEFFANKEFMCIQSRIDTEDPELIETVELINREAKVEGGNIHRHGLLNKPQSELRQELDNYLNFLEAISSLFIQGWLEGSDWTGLWNYYFRRIRNLQPLWEYTQHYEYEWDDLIESIVKADDIYAEKPTVNIL